MESENIRKVREFWCRVFGLPLSVLDDIDDYGVNGTKPWSDHVERKKKEEPKKKEKKKKKRR